MPREWDTRDAVAVALTASLQGTARGSRVSLRGSMAGGQTDAYSDIDLLWVVSDGAVEQAARGVRSAAEAAIGPLVWVRVDPDLLRCDRRRILSIRFAELPIFWRVDLDIRAGAVAADDGFGIDDPAAGGPPEHPAASAFENAVATLKMLRRGRPADARGLLERGFARIDERYDGRVGEAAALRLAEVAADRDPSLRALAAALRATVHAS